METPKTNKSLGQHWLYDEDSLLAMVESAEVGATDTVLEVGPGLGTLTEVLVKKAQQVIAVEFDKNLAKDLPKRLPAKNLKVVSQDILKYDFGSLPRGFKLVANIPYYLTSNLIRQISESTNSPEIAVLLIQKEVAERVASPAGGMSLLSVSAQYYWEVSLGKVVPAELFSPPPKIDSQILILKKRARPLFNDIDEKQFFRLVKAGFASRRKTLHNSLANGLKISKPDSDKLLVGAGINPSARPQELDLESWYRLYKEYASS